MDRSVDIEDYLAVKDITSWAKPKGHNIFERIIPATSYFEKQKSQ